MPLGTLVENIILTNDLNPDEDALFKMMHLLLWRDRARLRLRMQVVN